MVDSTQLTWTAYRTMNTTLYRFRRKSHPPPRRFRADDADAAATAAWEGCCAAVEAPAAGDVHLGRYTRTASIRFESHSLSIVGGARVSLTKRQHRSFGVLLPRGISFLTHVVETEKQGLTSTR
jgi:hypothetical protein